VIQTVFPSFFTLISTPVQFFPPLTNNIQIK